MRIIEISNKSDANQTNYTSTNKINFGIYTTLVKKIKNIIFFVFNGNMYLFCQENDQNVNKV